MAIAPRSEWKPGSSIWWDIAAIALIGIVAILLRFVDLASIPRGIQGDEAMAVLEGRNTLHVGWFGVWDLKAGGFPAGFIYLAAPMVRVFGNSILAVRYLSCGLDVISVIALYVLLRRSFGFGTAFVGSLLLATSAWHIQFSRIAFPNILWPMFVIIGCLTLVEALRRDSLPWWAASGASMALAVYSYNGHFLYLGVLAAFFAWHFYGWRGLALVGAGWIAFVAPTLPTYGFVALMLVIFCLSGRMRDRWVLQRVGSFGSAFLIVAYPMASFILHHQTVYFTRGRKLSIFRTEEWTSISSTGGKIHFVLDRYWEFWVRLTQHPVTDGVDGSGAAAIVPVAAMILCGLGVLFGMTRRRHPVIDLSIMTILVMPIAALSADDLALRRAMIIAPFLALLGGLGVVESVRLLWGRRIYLRVAICVVMLGLTSDVVYRNVDGFFNHTAKSDQMDWVMNVEWVQALDYMQTLPDGSYVYLFSNRWPYSHENRQLLDPNLPGESRGGKFGPDSKAVDRTLGRPVIVLMPDFEAQLPEFQQLYPGGQVVTGPDFWQDETRAAYTVYILPEQP